MERIYEINRKTNWIKISLKNEKVKVGYFLSGKEGAGRRGWKKKGLENVEQTPISR